MIGMKSKGLVLFDGSGKPAYLSPPSAIEVNRGKVRRAVSCGFTSRLLWCTGMQKEG